MLARSVSRRYVLRTVSRICALISSSCTGTGFDAPIEVAFHQVGAADIDLVVSAVPEPEDA